MQTLNWGQLPVAPRLGGGAWLASIPPCGPLIEVDFSVFLVHKRLGSSGQGVCVPVFSDTDLSTREQ